MDSDCGDHWRHVAAGSDEWSGAAKSGACTPVRRMRLLLDRGCLEVFLKLESYNVTGSSKDRTAMALCQALAQRGAIGPGSTIIESTSGNLGVALALMAKIYEAKLIAVVDPSLSPYIAGAMEDLGATLDVVPASSSMDGHLANRLARVRSLQAGDRNLVWTDQYNNEANTLAHYQGTGRELFRQLREPLDMVVVPVSTGGTLAGVGRRARECSPHTWIVGADLVGSAALGGRPGRRLLTGIGSSRRSTLLRAGDYDEQMQVSDDVAVSLCRLVFERTGLCLGGSSGAALAAAAFVASTLEGCEKIACVCPDGGERYMHSIYDDAWCLQNGIEHDPGPVRDVELGGWVVRPRSRELACQ